jgi:hypothetical protein
VINNAIDFEEFKGFSECIGQPIKTEKDFKEQILAKFTSEPSKGLTLSGFKDYWRKSVSQHGESMIWGWLEKLGYDRDLYSVRSRVFTLTVHSRCLDGEAPVELRIRDAIGTDIDEKTNKMIIKQYGKKEAEGEHYELYSRFAKGVYAFSYMMTNKGTAPIEALLDLNSCENMSFSTLNGALKKTIKPSETEFMMHAQAGFGEFTKAVKHSAKVV